MAAGGLWHHAYFHFYRADHVSLGVTVEKMPVAVHGVVADFPRFLPERPPRSAYEFAIPNRWRVPLQIQSVRDGETWKPASGQCDLIIQGDVLELTSGDSVQLFAQVSRPGPILNAGEFDFRRWMRGQRRQILLRSSYAECLQPILNKKRVSPSAISWLKNHVAQTLENSISDRHLGLAETIFLGRRDRLSEDVSEGFRKTGTVHLLALSGLHLGMLALIAFAMVRWIPGPDWLTPLFVLTFTLAYVLMVDSRPPVVRAFVIVAVYCVGQLFYRKNDIWNAWGWALLAVCFWNPTEIFQAGTQLSFLAVASLAAAGSLRTRFKKYDPLQELIAQSRPMPIKLARRIRGFVLDSFQASLMVWLVTCPLVLYHFHSTSPWTVLLSPVLMVPLALSLFGLMLLVGTPTMLADAIPLEWLVRWPLEGMHQLVMLTNETLPTNYWTPGPALWWTLGFYAVLGIAVWGTLCRKWSIRLSVGLLAIWCAIGLTDGIWKFHQANSRTDFRCTFVSVGHGTSVLMEFPGGKNLIYDCGRLGSPSRATESLSSVLWRKGITHLDGVIISHDDADHYNGFPEVMQRFSVGNVFCSELMQKIPSRSVEQLLGEIDARAIPVTTISAGRSLSVGGVEMTILHPTRKGVLGRDNANSVVLLVEFAGRRILLPGDLESPGTEAVISERPIDCDLVMAPHHGSQYSHADDFYAWCQPEWIIVSSGKPMEKDLEDREVWLNTAECGTIAITIDSRSGTLEVDVFSANGNEG